MRYLKDILPQEELRNCVITYCRNKGRRLPTDTKNRVKCCLISDKTLQWLLKELENIRNGKYHRWYAPVGLTLAHKEILKNLEKEKQEQ